MARIVSLFSGCGGLDAGFLSCGHDVILAMDHDQAAVETYNRNFPRVANRRDLSVDIEETHKAEIVIAGPPCQGFSTIGLLHPDDHRNSLFAKSCEHAVKINPELIIIENVPGLTSVNNRATLDQGRSILSAAGYYIEIQTVCCEDYGVAQRRRRVFLVARSKNRPFLFAMKQQLRQTVGEVFERLTEARSESAKWLEPNTTAWKIARRILPGQKMSDVRSSAMTVHSWQIPEVFGEATTEEVAVLKAISRLRRVSRTRKIGDGDPVSPSRLKNELDFDPAIQVHSLLEKGYLKANDAGIELARTFNGTFRRLDSNSISPTVDTHFLSPRLFLHPTQDRGMSYVEAAALQGFPEEFSWPNASGTRIRQIGNAVPPPVSTALALSVSELV